MIGTLLRTAVRVLIVLVLAVAGALIVLQRTNPRPSDDEGTGWTELAPMPQARGEVAAAVAGGRVFVVGGLRGFTTTSDRVDAYDIQRDRWQRLPYTTPRRHHAAAAALAGRVFVSGGASGATDWTPRKEVFSVDARGMKEEHPMPEGRQGHAMVAVGSRLYVVGGVGPTDDTLIYDGSRKRWTRGSAIPQSRDHLRAVAWGGKIWAIGGRAGGDVLDRVDVYDPRRDRWTDGPALPEPMSAMAVGVISDRLQVVGGEEPDLFGGEVIESHYMLAPGRREWTVEGQVLLPVHGAGYGVHRGRLYVVGGASRQGALSTISWTATTQSYLL